MKKIQMILALACMASLTACQEEGTPTSDGTSSTTSSSTQGETTTDNTSSGGDSGTIIPNPTDDFSTTEGDDKSSKEVEISEKDATDKSDVSEDAQLEDSEENGDMEVPFELPEDEEHRELLIYINEVDMIIESFEESLRIISGTAVEYLLDPANTALFDTYCQNMVEAGITLREIGVVLPPEKYVSLHAAFAEDCDSLAEAYQKMVNFLQSGSENSEEYSQLEVDMVELFTNMQDSFYTLGEATIDDYNG